MKSRSKIDTNACFQALRGKSIGIFKSISPRLSDGESEAPAELQTPKLGRSLTLPRNELGSKVCGSGSTKIHRAGLSLLEVILALAILAMSVALLSQITKQSTDNGLMAQRLATAQMLCESKMAEVLAGAIPLTSTPWTPITDSLRNGNWNYQIETITAQRKDMVGVRLSVTDQPDTTTENPELFFIVRWMIDPNLGLDMPPQSTDAAGGSTSSSGSGAATATGGSQ